MGQLLHFLSVHLKAPSSTGDSSPQTQNKLLFIPLWPHLSLVLPCSPFPWELTELLKEKLRVLLLLTLNYFAPEFLKEPSLKIFVDEQLDVAGTAWSLGELDLC